MTKVMILRGLPGSGKDSYLDSLEEADGVTIARCSADDYFMIDGRYDFDPMMLAEAHDACFKSFVQICDTPMPRLDIIAVCNTNASLFEISPYLMYARKEGLPVEIVEVSSPNAGVEYYAEKNIHGVLYANIEAMMDHWDESLPFWPSVTRVESHSGVFSIFGEKFERTIPHYTG